MKPSQLKKNLESLKQLTPKMNRKLPLTLPTKPSQKSPQKLLPQNRCKNCSKYRPKNYKDHLLVLFSKNDQNIQLQKGSSKFVIGSGEQIIWQTYELMNAWTL